MAGQAPQTGEAAIGQNTATPAPADASAKLAADAQRLGGDNIGGAALRIAGTTVDGAVHILPGMLHQAEEWYHHPMDLVKTVAESAAIGAAVKIILPETGPVAKVAGIAMGALFIGQAVPGIYQGYKEGYNAKSWSELNTASAHLGDTLGGLVDNMGVGIVGYKIGTGVAGNVLARQSFLGLDMDRFAEIKTNSWNAVDAKLPTFARAMGVPDPAEILKPKEVEGTNGAPARAEFQGSERAVPLDKAGKALPEQEIDPNQPISVKLKLTRQNQGTFDRYVERIKNGTDEPMTHDEFMKKFSVDPKSVQAAKQFAQAHGLEVGEINPGARSFELKGTIGQMQDAFSTRLVTYLNPDDGGSFRGRTGTYSVPTEMADHVQSVLGFDQRDVVKPQYIMAVDPTAEKVSLLGDNADQSASLVSEEAAGKPKPGKPHPKPKALQPPMAADDIAKAYGADPDTYTNAGRNHVFNSFGGTVDAETIADAKSAGFNPKNFKVKVLTGDGEAPAPDVKGANVENELDFITQARNLRKATVTMTANDNSTQGFVGAIDYVNHPSDAINYDGSSTSWGGPDKQAWNAQGRAAMDESLKDGIALGKMHSFSSGDDGVSDRGSLKAQTDYPASSGNGVAVGGTELLASKDAKGNVTRTSEVTWGTANPKDGAAGGGVSAVEDRPVYQQFITWVKGLVPGTKGRIVPDISADASPRTPVEVPTSMGTAGVGGTSFSNPLFYAMTRQLSEASGKPIGFINAQLYKWGQDPVIAKKVFFDITEGDNGMGKPGYHAGPGYDAATGWGSPNFQGMLAELKNPTHPLVSGLRSTAFGIQGGALRTAHTLMTNPGSLDFIPKGINGQDNTNK